MSILCRFGDLALRKKCGLNKKKLVAMATSLERSHPNFTVIIYADADLHMAQLMPLPLGPVHVNE